MASAPDRCRHVEDFLNVEIRFAGRGRTDRVSLVGFADVERGTVDLGVNGNGSDPHLVTRADHAYRNLATVRDENLLEHRDPRTQKLAIEIEPNIVLDQQTRRCDKAKGIHHKNTQAHATSHDR